MAIPPHNLPPVAERRKWIRYPCLPREAGGHLIAYVSGGSLAEAVRDLSAGGVCLVLGDPPGDGALTVELCSLRTRFRCTLPARAVSVAGEGDRYVVGVAFRWRLSVKELRRLLA